MTLNSSAELFENKFRLHFDMSYCGSAHGEGVQKDKVTKNGNYVNPRMT